ncbi:Uncharacterised protein [Sphingobacterium spiritivorum]|uniref:Uncharacterized protein n=1 Tax=Sphingobacterium spiritivorum TaxID=258 RepID=A0A380CRW1_SPHSI|nr:DUF4406 domain-containing protein [Sphingobacterium spiritivorum]SUJ26386.1 Uncharacterised protein [Sphingobacterium spiritivorum]
MKAPTIISKHYGTTEADIMNIQRIMTDNLFNKVVSYYKAELNKLHNRPGSPDIKIVYIGGQFTRRNYVKPEVRFSDHKEQFKALADKLIKEGYVVINACDLISQDEEIETAIRICIALMGFADFIAMIKDLDTESITIETSIAYQLNIPIAYY